ncbi:hypothetical protein L226DRAFT_157587 [Lentinus tigrinus ALCF2SS1-7]|uniref:CFEM domain-containing protein n=1 Tax=Lentinus tigrinus ALCF2SS1-6 TaxID=1328759 RepID=A0A5C2S9Q4_9APHY|nr:hypothetical protein L227DRAFT_195847 [Lentinus tigrinus ALCF2SS1-6]RPD72245.1 hypothetical protein L226DRAFT_157587 [Lentinus tigrinus ALCF2SS1-7]
MFSKLPLPLLLLTLASYVAAQASLTPPPISASDASSSVNPTSAPSSSGSGSSSGSTSATATSSAQFPSLSGLSDCANNCLALAISQVGCQSVVDVNCYCSPRANATRFASSLVACSAVQNCTDLTSAESIAEQFCALASTSTFVTFPTSAPSTSFSIPFSSSSSSVSSSANRSSTTVPSSASTSASTTSASAGQGNAALPLVAAGHATLAAGVFGLAGALLGAFVA